MKTNKSDANFLGLKSILRLLRIAHGYSLKEMANRLGISATYVSDIESQKSEKKPSLELLDKYAEEFKMKTSEILMLAEENKDTNDNIILLKRILNVLVPEENDKITDEVKH